LQEIGLVYAAFCLVMTNINIVSMSFAKFGKHRLAMFAGSVVVALTDNPAFPNPPVSIVDLKAASDAFAMNVSLTPRGGIILTATQKEARALLVGLLRDEAHYVQIIAKESLPTLLSSGFAAIDRNSAQKPLVAPLIRKVLRERSEQLRLILKAVPNARLYQAQLKVGDGDWQDGGIHSQARRLVLTNLVPGTVYQIRVRALGGSTRYSPWSMVTSCMAV
jgi:hypothetical protein